jgi:hypothetical protein
VISRKPRGRLCRRDKEPPEGNIGLLRASVMM